MNFISQIAWNMEGLIPAIAQDAKSNRVLMMAWMNKEALQATVFERRAVYWSRSRNKLWRKGEQSGNIQRLVGLHLDCDSDTILLKVKQTGYGACHTGRESCFFRVLHDNNWSTIDEVIRDPEEMYR
ncbi:MAG: phosphoribosyl-AMP cyclohydrolase [Cellvibrionales bacterium TMED49]|nr:MAG: phosphoribosyl-AMP cyclohydrolase [Cellvibrionales bacterium TMED49]|tara:strand:- start:2 stop:382 length:381 start_codon:yes stop_codon:yes gene_type:complete